MTTRVVLATGNAGKLTELQALLSGLPLSLESQTALGVESVPETGTTFVENAIIKARHAAEVTGLAAIADDSGLEVDVLRGAPGIRSARYAGDGASDADNIDRLLEALSHEGNRAATFRCVIVYMRHADDPMPVIAHGSWQGSIETKRQGTGGFGYDPVFFVPSLNKTAAELKRDEKNRVSHRALALRSLKSQMTGLTLV